VKLTPRKLVHYLLDTGLIDPAALVEGDLVISDSTRRHRNFRVHRRQGEGCFVKQAQAGHALSEVSLHREAVCYWLVANDPHFSALQSLLPGYRHYDAARQTLVLELLPEAENLSEHHLRLGVFPNAPATLLGEALGRAHRDVRDPGPEAEGMQVFPRALPWVLGIHTLVASQFVRLSAANAQMLDIVAGQPGFRAALDALRAGWRINGLIHGDMKWDNCLVLPAADDTSTPRLRIVDWELADFGDTAWDAGGVLQSYLTFWILSMPAHEEASAEQLVDRAGYRLEAMQPAMRAFWQAYANTLGAEGDEARELLQRCVQYAAARMIQTAYETLGQAPAMSRSALRLLQVSVNMLTRPQDATRDLLGLEVRA
jgi:hypothetical protein